MTVAETYAAILAALEATDETAITQACRDLVVQVTTMAEAVRAAYNALPTPAPTPDPELAQLLMTIQQLQTDKDTLEADVQALEEDVVQLQRAIASVEAENARLATAE